MTHYFLKHPVVALILNAMIILLGLLSYKNLSLREYPEVSYPTVQVKAFYPNASADLVESSVTGILEDQLAGVEGLKVLESDSQEGFSTITLNFREGLSLDRALVAIRDAISLAKGKLPKEVREPVIERKTPRSNGLPFMLLSLESTTLDFGALNHYANTNVRNGFRSLNGVSSVEVWGQPYTMEISLDPKKMRIFQVNADEIYQVLSQNNFSLPVGKFRNEVPTTLNVELNTLEDFENLLIKDKNFEDPKHKKHPVFLKYVADITQKTDDKQFRVWINGKPGLCIAINPANDANPLEVSNLVRTQLEELQHSLPGITSTVVVDQADFIRASIKGIQWSIIEAILLVLAIVFLFLRNFRATLIPLVTIPISMIGALLFLNLFGYSLNIITLLAMVLAVGLVVDDAIVVLENISRHIEEGLSPREAAFKGSKQIGFAIVAMTLTLTSVYAPIAFIEGIVGQLFVEFAVALAGSVLISGLVALTLSPLMCARILKPHTIQRLPQVDQILTKISDIYTRALGSLIYRRRTALSIAFACVLATGFFVKYIPSELAPPEDRGMMGIWSPPIPGKDMNAMEKNMISAEKILTESVPEAQGKLTFMGFWGGGICLPLKPIQERKRSAEDIVKALRPLVSVLPSIDVHVWNNSSGLPGMDGSGGLNEVSLIISTTESYRTLFQNLEKVQERLTDDISQGKNKAFEKISHDLKLDTSAYSIDLDINRLSKLNLTAAQIAKTIEVFFVGDQSLQFQKDGVLYPLTLKGKTTPWTLNELYVTNRGGSAISLGAVATMTSTTKPQLLFHHNQMRAAKLTAYMAPGETLESAMPKFMKAVNSILPPSYKKSWADAAKVHKESSSTMVLLFVLALVFVYAILSIQFENFVDPCIVLLTVPLACSGALFVTWIFGQSLNIYTQVGLITLIGLITKHGILIVEFTNQLRQEGVALAEAVQQAAALRLRPILMTTGAMIVGAVPLIISQDAGSEARHAIGTILMGGLSFGTLFTLFVIPPLAYMIKSWQKSPQKSPMAEGI